MEERAEERVKGGCVYIMGGERGTSKMLSGLGVGRPVSARRSKATVAGAHDPGLPVLVLVPVRRCAGMEGNSLSLG